MNESHYERLKLAILYSGIIEDANSIEDIHTTLKEIADSLYMNDIHKCVGDVCHPVLSKKELSKEEVAELIEVAEDLCLYMAKAVNNGLCTLLLEKIRTCFSTINISIEFNEDIKPVILTMKQFYTLVYDYRDEFIKLESDQIELVHRFVKYFKKWVHLIFELKSDNVNQLDDCIISNYQLIKEMVDNLNSDYVIDLDNIC